MRFSVLIPVYNSEKYLTHCIQSVLDQTFQDFEIIFCDDASTDGSGKILAAYAEKDSRIKIIRHSRNRTAMISRNDLVRAASGEYITFIDSDDFVDRCYLETGNRILLQDPVDILSFPLHGWNRAGDLKIRLTGKDVFEYYFFQSACPWTACSRFYSRKLLTNSLLPDAEIARMDDFLAVVPAFYSAQTARFEKKPAMYHYNLGCGGGGKKSYSAQNFRRFSRGFSLTFRILRDFMLSRNEDQRHLDQLSSMLSCNILLELMDQEIIEGLDKKTAMMIFISDRTQEELAEILAQQKMLSNETPIREGMRIFIWFLGIVIQRWEKRIKGMLS